jgi:hypothetical protein
MYLNQISLNGGKMKTLIVLFVSILSQISFAAETLYTDINYSTVEYPMANLVKTHVQIENLEDCTAVKKCTTQIEVLVPGTKDLAGYLQTEFFRGSRTWELIVTLVDHNRSLISQSAVSYTEIKGLKLFGVGKLHNGTYHFRAGLSSF